MNTTPPLTYQPFSNGTEFDIWHSRNCQQCAKASMQDAPECPGDEALTLALFDEGQITASTCDFIGTQRRAIQDEGTADECGFCTLNRVCNHFQPQLTV